MTAPQREDYGIAQLEALADGCLLVTTPSPGPYAALPLARSLDPRLVQEGRRELGDAVRGALDEPLPDYGQRAAAAPAPWRRAEVDRRGRRGAAPAAAPATTVARMTPITGQAVLITGAAHGIGAEVARRLAARGARVALVGLGPEELERVSAECPGSIAVEADARLRADDGPRGL